MIVPNKDVVFQPDINPFSTLKRPTDYTSIKVLSSRVDLILKIIHFNCSSVKRFDKLSSIDNIIHILTLLSNLDISIGIFVFDSHKVLLVIYLNR
jgi:hypothetical protein